MQLVRGEQVQCPVRTALAIYALTLNFVRARGILTQVPRTNRWSPRMTGQQILHVDASYSEDDFTGACGAVLRDNRGGFIRAATARLDHIPDVVSAEAAALLEGLKLAQSTGCNNLLVRMDNLDRGEGPDLSMR